MNVGQRQVSVLSPLLFIAVVEVISRKTSMREILRKLIYADDMAVVADTETDLQEWSMKWKEIFGSYGQRISLEKMEVLWVGQQNKDLDKDWKGGK